MRNALLKGFMAAMRPPDRSAPWKWAESHIVVDDTSPFPGRWRSEKSPWVKKPMEDAANPKVRRVVVKCCSQAAKTQMVLNLVCWAINEEPGPGMYVMAARDEAQDFMRDRVVPTFKGCRPVRSQMLKQAGMTCLFASMPFYFTGAWSKSKMQSKPIRWLFLDEIRNYPPWALDLVLKRTKAFRNAKEYLISTADVEGDAIDGEFKNGTQESWHIRCPKCGRVQPLDFFRLKYDKAKLKEPAGLIASIHYPCEAKCGHVWKNTEADRRQIADEGRFVARNPNCQPDVRSYEWNALLPTWVMWDRLVYEYENAVAAARTGNFEPLKTFYNEQLGQSWSEALGVITDFDFLKERFADYDFGDDFPEEIARFMAADRQEFGGEHYFWVIRAFGAEGESRLIACGRAETTEELEELRETYGVKAANAMIDSGHKATEVYRWCQKFGWKAFKGMPVDFFTVSVKDENGKPRPVRRLWNKSSVDPSFGTKKNRRKAGPLIRDRIPLFLWANDTTKDFLAEFMHGLVGRWTIPRNPGKDYLSQMTAEQRVSVEVGRNGQTVWTWRRIGKRDNHYWDCELMITIAAVASKIVQAGVARAPKVPV
jgi:phage terminase large subunit GpA-like protein